MENYGDYNKVLFDSRKLLKVQINKHCELCENLCVFAVKKNTNMKKLIYLHLFTFMTLVSCDPPHSLSFVNKTNQNARVIIKLNDKIIENENLTYCAKGDSIFFDLNKDKDSTFSFGMGNWNDVEIMSIVNDIKSIKIKTRTILLSAIKR